MKSSLIFLTGMAMGTVLGLLIAPESGRATARKIKREADRLVDRIKQKGAVRELTREQIPE